MPMQWDMKCLHGDSYHGTPDRRAVKAMKADGKYRFNLQFPAETAEQIKAGELLERAGNRKSMIVVEALNTYLDEHPDILESGGKIVVHTIQRYDRNEIEQMIRTVVKEHFALYQDSSKDAVISEQEDGLEVSISQMLDNLDFFQ